MNIKYIAIGIIVGGVLLFVPLVRLVGPLLAGASIGVLIASNPMTGDRDYLDGIHSVIAGVVLGFLYLITVSGIGTSILYHSINYELFIEYSVRTIQSQFKDTFFKVTGIERISIVYFSLLVGLYAFGTTVLGGFLGKWIGNEI